ncbi:MAG TPA: polysaccharide deacetylase family protein [Vicinamibacterales bacterium]|jgi:peptidoglycan/xylan/chitin deacetylase (PgdA/CDA1 family)
MTSRQRVNYAIKVVVSHALYYLGLLQLWQRIVMRRKAVILMYHRVLTPEELARTGSHPALVVSRETFARQMALLKRRFSVLTVNEFASRLERKVPFENSSCLITFDDGWQDNVDNALPILERHNLPALVFLPANYVGSRRLFWQEALTHLLRRVVAEVRSNPARRGAFARILEPAGLEHLLELADADPRTAIIDAIASQKRLTRSSIEDLQQALARELKVSLDDLSDVDGFIGWTDVERMAVGGISFGGHGVDHLLLTQVSDDDVRREVRGSKQMMQDKFAQTVPTFSYPNGYWTPPIAREVEDAGYRLAFTTKRGFVSCSDEPFTVRRLNIHEAVTNTTPMFLARVVGLL